MFHTNILTVAVDQVGQEDLKALEAQEDRGLAQDSDPDRVQDHHSDHMVWDVNILSEDFRGMPLRG